MLKPTSTSKPNCSADLAEKELGGLGDAGEVRVHLLNMSCAGAAAKNGGMAEKVTDEVSGLKSTPSKPSSTSKPSGSADAEKKIVEVPNIQK